MGRNRFKDDGALRSSRTPHRNDETAQQRKESLHRAHSVAASVCANHLSMNKHATPRKNVKAPTARKMFGTDIWSMSKYPEIKTPAMLPIVLAAMMSPLILPTWARWRVERRIM